MEQEPVRDEIYVVISLFLGLLAALFALSASYFQDYHPGRGHLFLGSASARPAPFPARVQLRPAETTSSPAAAAFAALTAGSATPAPRAMPKVMFAGVSMQPDRHSHARREASISRSRGAGFGLARIAEADATPGQLPTSTPPPITSTPTGPP